MTELRSPSEKGNNSSFSIDSPVQSEHNFTNDNDDLVIPKPELTTKKSYDNIDNPNQLFYITEINNQMENLRKEISVVNYELDSTRGELQNEREEKVL